MIVALCCGLLMLAFPGLASAIELEKLVMPGPLIQGHAEFEGDCGSCHARLRDTDQRALCLECHDAISSDVAAQSGFHGLSPRVAQTDCRTCHTDHQGRDADVIGLDPLGFDHSYTDYPLKGAHAAVACASCHVAEAEYREAPSDCFACHEADDAHRGELGPDCGDCHSEAIWQKTAFDHDETEFPLIGKHADVACSLCHQGQQFEDTATDCNSCHRVGDAHRGRFGEACGDCHSPTGWQELRFDHARDTGFALRGAHAPTACESCHTSGLTEPLSTDCVSCHLSEDVHRGRNGNSCEQCHGEISWADEKFDHTEMTEFPLRGAHVEVSCERCHTAPVYEQSPGSGCVDCHKLDDVHDGQQGDSCVQCHNETAWTHRVFFEHDVSNFPLLGLHAVASCEQCHATARFRDASDQCSECHATQDKHLGRLGSDCAQCHNPNGWQRWRFDHAVQTDFALEGAHAGIDCQDCHRTAVEGRVSASAACASCHARDDRHRGAFGRDCARCHGVRSWREIDMNELR